MWHGSSHGRWWPWIFLSQGKCYIIVVDYYPRYFDIYEMRKMTSRATINYLKTSFSKVGIPLSVRCENRTNLVYHELRELAREMGFQIVPSSSKYLESNGLAKEIGKGEFGDGSFGVQDDTTGSRSVPRRALMGRKLRGTLPIPTSSSVARSGGIPKCWQREEKVH